MDIYYNKATQDGPVAEKKIKMQLIILKWICICIIVMNEWTFI